MDAAQFILAQTFLRNDLLLLLAVMGGAGLVMVLAFIVCNALQPGWERQRMAEIPREIASAFASACKACESCLAMCDVTAVTETLQAGSHRTIGSGPTEAELLAKRKAASGKALTKCRRLSVEAVNLTVDARYVLLRGLFQCAGDIVRRLPAGAGTTGLPGARFSERFPWKSKTRFGGQRS